jgi:hypothetical protein
MSLEIGYLERIIIPMIIATDKQYTEKDKSFLNSEIGRRTDEIKKNETIKVRDSLIARVDMLIGEVSKSDKYTETRRLLNALRDVLRNKPKSTSPLPISKKPDLSFPASSTPVPGKPSETEVKLLDKIGQGLTSTRRGGRRKRHRRKTVKTR